MRTLASILILGLFFVSCSGQTPGVKNISTNEFNRQVSAGDKTVIDVRTPEEYSSGHLKGAKNIDWYDSNFLKLVEASFPDKTKPVYLYCRSGGRSGQAATTLGKAGYQEVINMTGGMNAWQAENLPVE